MSNPIRIAVTCAAGQIAYNLLYMIAKGEVFGTNQPIILILLDITTMLGILEGMLMELNDCALPLVRAIFHTDDPAVAFKDVSAAILIGAMLHKQDTERKDLLSASIKILKIQGEALDKHAKKDVKVLVVGNLANTNAFVCSHYAPSIPKENFSAMSRWDQNRAHAEIAAKVGFPVESISNVIIWGNHSSTRYPYAEHAIINIANKIITVPDAVQDDVWLRTTFVDVLQNKNTTDNAKKLHSAMSTSRAISDHLKDWFTGTSENTFVSMGVNSDGSYGTIEDTVFSFPVIIKSGKWKILKGLPVDDFSRKMLDITIKELEEERQEAIAIIESMTV